MLTLRNKQMETLQRVPRKKLHRALLAHVKHYFPAQTARKNDFCLLTEIHKAHRRAATYGLKTEKEIYLFVNIAIVYGADFDQKEETAWTRAYLTDEDISSPGQRLDRLHEAVVARLEVAERLQGDERRSTGKISGAQK